jgi:hypothetical protein
MTTVPIILTQDRKIAIRHQVATIAVTPVNVKVILMMIRTRTDLMQQPSRQILEEARFLDLVQI